MNEILSAVLQIIGSVVIAYSFFEFRKDKSVKFSEYIGAYKAPWKSILYGVFTSLILLSAMLILVFSYEGIREAVFAPNSVTGKLRLAGFNIFTLITLLLIAWFKTSLSEEIFFRGLIGKRLINRLGFDKGNLLQAVIFGLFHFLLFWKLTDTGFIPLLIMFVFTTTGGWIIGFIKEKFAGGSIVPGWIAHGLANTISYTVIAFLM